MQCYDSSYPDVVDVSDVTISVTRNLNAPVFELPNYQETIPETFALGVQILQVSAVDSDGDSVTYSITGDAFGLTNRANEYYYIDAITGVISLKKPLTAGSHVEDNVRYTVFSHRPPPPLVWVILDSLCQSIHGSIGLFVWPLINLAFFVCTISQ